MSRSQDSSELTQYVSIVCVHDRMGEAEIGVEGVDQRKDATELTRSASGSGLLHPCLIAESMAGCVENLR